MVERLLSVYSLSFKPITPMTMRAKDNIRIIPAGSLNQTIPIRNVPAAPIPVHTA